MPAPSQSDLAVAMRATAEAFLQTWTGDWADAAAPNLALRAPNCEHTILPSSLKRSKETNDVWAEKFARIAALVTKSKMTLDDYVAAPEVKRAVARSHVEAQTPVGPYHNEYVWFFTFDQSGQKITQITEFIDVEAAKSIMHSLAAEGYYYPQSH